jgi:hypothetical protein
MGEEARLATTAYVAWAVFGGGKAAGSASPTRQYLLARGPAELNDPNTLALVCNALLAVDPQGGAAGPYLDRLEALKKTAADGKLAWWELPAGGRTMFYGAGRSGSVETTALATLAFLQSGRHPGTARAALAWLVTRKDPNGTWYSTQATVLALKALLAGTNRPLGGDRRILVHVGKHDEVLSIPANQAEVLKSLDVTAHLKAGRTRLRLTETTATGSGYQITLRYHIPEKKEPEKEGPLALSVSYDRTVLAVGEVVRATARVTNRTAAAAPMVMLDLPVPPGFTLDTGELSRLVRAGVVGRYQVQARGALVYLRSLPPGAPLELTYTLRANQPVRAAAPAARAYEYYAPERQGRSAPVSFRVWPAGKR